MVISSRFSLSSGKLPELELILKAKKFAYTWIWALVKFIEDTYGQAIIPKIVKEVKNGEVFAVIGVKLSDFDKAWRKWFFGGGEVKTAC